jgi:hypothetical protein
MRSNERGHTGRTGSYAQDTHGISLTGRGSKSSPPFEAMRMRKIVLEVPSTIAEARQELLNRLASLGWKEDYFTKQELDQAAKDLLDSYNQHEPLTQG